MNTIALDSPRLRDIAPVTEGIGCQSDAELVSRLREANAVKRPVPWKSELGCWQPHEADAQTRMVEVVVAPLTASAHEVEQVSADKESCVPEELRELAKALPDKRAYEQNGTICRGEMAISAKPQMHWLYGCLAGHKWLIEKTRTKAEKKAAHFSAESEHTSNPMLSPGLVNSRLGEKEAPCSVLVEGVDEPLSLADALAIATNWEVVNERRVSLIEKKASEQLAHEESSELQHLQQLAWARRQMVMPLPLKELEAIEEGLRRMQLCPDE